MIILCAGISVALLVVLFATFGRVVALGREIGYLKEQKGNKYAVLNVQTDVQINRRRLAETEYTLNKLMYAMGYELVLIPATSQKTEMRKRIIPKPMKTTGRKN